MKVEERPLGWYVDRLNGNSPFSIMRYGDGEFNCMMSQAGRDKINVGVANSDHHEYFPELGKALRGILDDPQDGIIYGLQGFCRTAMYDRYKAELEKCEHIPWVDATVFANASIEGKLFPFVEALKKHRVMFVGPQYLWLSFDFSMFRVCCHVDIEEKNCYLQKQSTLALADLNIEKQRPSVVSIQAGMLSNIIIDKLYPKYGQSVTFLDLGTLWDVYAGRHTRSYHKNMSEETIRKNSCG